MRDANPNPKGGDTMKKVSIATESSAFNGDIYK